MRRRASSKHGLLRALLINMMFQFELLLLTAAMLVLHVWLHWPILLFWIALGIWILVALAVTLFVTWAAKCSMPDPNARCTSSRLKQKNSSAEHHSAEDPSK